MVADKGWSHRSKNNVFLQLWINHKAKPKNTLAPIFIQEKKDICFDSSHEEKLGSSW